MKKTATRTLLLAVIGGSLLLSACSDRQNTPGRGSAAVSPSSAVQETASGEADSPEELRKMALTQAAAAAGRTQDKLDEQAADPEFPIEAPTFPAPSVSFPPAAKATPAP